MHRMIPCCPLNLTTFHILLLVKAFPIVQALYADALKATKEHKRAVVGAAYSCVMQLNSVLAGQLNHPSVADVLSKSTKLEAAS